MAEVSNFKGSVEDLTKQIEGFDGLTVVDIYAQWCPSCKRLGMLLPKIAEEHTNVQFLKIDVDENPEIKEHFGVESIPVVKLFKKGGNLKDITTIVGVNVQQIKEAIANNK